MGTPMHCTRRTVVCRAQASSPSLFVFGLGYTSLGLVRSAERQGGVWDRIVSTSRRPERLRRLETAGHSIVRYDPAGGADLDPAAADALATASHILTSIPPAGLHLYDPITRAQLRALRARAAAARAGDAPPLQWVGVLSSTSVYGDAGGGWVDESSPAATTSSRGLVRLEHEQAWEALAREHGLPLHIFRLGGIYGPGRSILDSIAKADADLSGSQRRRGRQRYISRTHAADIASVLLASMAAPGLGADPLPGAGNRSNADPAAAPAAGAPTQGAGSNGSSSGSSSEKARADAGASGGGYLAVFNVADDEPAGREEVEAYARQLLGLPQPPPQPAAAPSDDQGEQGNSSSGGSGAGRRGSRGELEEKRVANGRIQKVLGVQLRYPTYREGLAAIAAGSADPFVSLEDVAVLAGRPVGGGGSGGGSN